MTIAGNRKYSTLNRKANGGAEGPQYDEIPYGDVPPPGISGKGQLPDVPAEYSQVPQLPARQGTFSIRDSLRQRTAATADGRSVKIFTSSTYTHLSLSAFLLALQFHFHLSRHQKNYNLIISNGAYFCISVGGSIATAAGGEEDISPYATFHLLGMREEQKNAAAAANFQTLPPQQQAAMQQRSGPNTPAHMSQTMNVREREVSHRLNGNLIKMHYPFAAPSQHGQPAATTERL